MINTALMPSIRNKKWTWCLFLRLIQASLANATMIYNKLHPDEKKSSKDIVQEMCEYYIEKFSDIHTERRQKITVHSSEEHEMRIGIRRKCGILMYTVRTQKYCTKCKMNMCNTHKNDHL